MRDFSTHSLCHRRRCHRWDRSASPPSFYPAGVHAGLPVVPGKCSAPSAPGVHRLGLCLLAPMASKECFASPQDTTPDYRPGIPTEGERDRDVSSV